MLTTLTPYPIWENYAPSIPLSKRLGLLLVIHIVAHLCLPRFHTTCSTFYRAYAEHCCRTRPAFHHDVEGLRHWQEMEYLSICNYRRLSIQQTALIQDNSVKDQNIAK